MKLEFGSRKCFNFYNFFSNTSSDLLSNFETPFLKLILFFLGLVGFWETLGEAGVRWPGSCHGHNEKLMMIKRYQLH